MNYKRLWFDVKTKINLYEKPPALLLVDGTDVVKMYYYLKAIYNIDMLLENVTFEIRTDVFRGVCTTDVVIDEGKFFGKVAPHVLKITVLFMMPSDIMTAEITKRGELIIPEIVAEKLLDLQQRKLDIALFQKNLF